MVNCSWSVISDDITAQVDRNTWPVMDRYWGVDAVVKDVSTSLFGMAVSLEASRVKEDLVYVGTDDGVIFEEISSRDYDNDSFYEDKTINKLARAERKTVVDHWGRFQIKAQLGQD